MNKDSIRHDVMFRYLVVLTIASFAGFQTWRTLFNNFAVEIAHLDGYHIGVIQSAREIPGFLALLAIILIMIIKEHRLAALSMIIMGLGISLTGYFPSYMGLIFTTILMSFGFHYFETTNQSLTLQYFDQNISPWVFGKLRSYAAATNIGIGLVIFIGTIFLTYSQIYLFMGLAVILVGIWGLLQQPTREDIVPQRKKMILRKKYWLYYFLTFMAGARRQIFTAFAVFLLVKKFEFSIQEITLLFVANNAINFFVSPQIGKAIIRFGERKVLTVEYSTLIAVFIAYAYVDSKWIVTILYILDHIVFNFSIAIRTYFQKIGDPRDIAPSMAVGFTINHIAAIVIPAMGGIVWMIDYRIPFLAGAAMSVISLSAVQLIRTIEKEKKV
jgi:predicted MFS family arabinose efflux permease